MTEPSGSAGPWRFVLPSVLVLLLAGTAGAWWLSREGCRHSWRAHPGPVRALAVNRDGTLLATGGDDHVVRLWGLEGGKQGELTGHGGAVTALAFAPDGGRLVSASGDG